MLLWWDMLGSCHMLTSAYRAAAAVHHPVHMDKEGERKTTPAMLLCDDH